MVQDIDHTREDFKPGALNDSERLGNRHVPLERILVANEELLTKTSGCSIGNDEGWIGPKIRTDQTRINCQALQISECSCRTTSQTSEWRVKEFLDLR